MDKPTCSIEDCTKPAVTRGWCNTHYSRWKRAGNPGADIPVVARHPVHAPDATCAADGCDRSPGNGGSRGWCQAHYLRWKKTGDVAADVPIASRIFHAPGMACAVDGCDVQASDREWCNFHYERWRVAGDPLAPLRRSLAAAKPSCSIKGCSKPAKGRGWCDTHWLRWRKYGDPLYERVKPAACSAEGCDGEPDSRGLCTMHYTRWLRHGDLETHFPALKPNNEIGYYLFHERLRKTRGSSTEYQCVLCPAQAINWAWIHGEDPADFSSYVPMCRTCHMRYDLGTGRHVIGLPPAS